MSHQPGQFVAAEHDIEVSTMVVIVVGAQIVAEIRDRPIAAWLRDEMNAKRASLSPHAPLRCVLCTDLWYLNNQPLRLRPTIAVGSPEINAASACLAGCVPTTMVVDGSIRIHVDLETSEPRACIWGENAEATRAAAELFAKRYGEEFLRASMDPDARASSG